MAWRFGFGGLGVLGLGMGLIFPPGSEGLGLGEENEDNK